MGVRLANLLNSDGYVFWRNKIGLVESDPEAALAGFAEVVRMEPEKAEW